MDCGGTGILEQLRGKAELTNLMIEIWFGCVMLQKESAKSNKPIQRKCSFICHLFGMDHGCQHGHGPLRAYH